MPTHPDAVLDVAHVPALELYLDRLGGVFRRFAEQGSGCVSYGVEVAGRRWFVKGAATRGGVASPGDIGTPGGTDWHWCVRGR
jgi:hypothetical protein